MYILDNWYKVKERKVPKQETLTLLLSKILRKNINIILMIIQL